MNTENETTEVITEPEAPLLRLNLDQPPQPEGEQDANIDHVGQQLLEHEEQPSEHHKDQPEHREDQPEQPQEEELTIDDISEKYHQWVAAYSKEYGELVEEFSQFCDVTTELLSSDSVNLTVIIGNRRVGICC